MDDLSKKLAARDRLRRKLARQTTYAQRLAAMARFQEAACEILRRSPEGYAHFLRRNFRARAIPVPPPPVPAGTQPAPPAPDPDAVVGQFRGTGASPVLQTVERQQHGRGAHATSTQTDPLPPMPPLDLELFDVLRRHGVPSVVPRRWAVPALHTGRAVV
jgi:hypothetical protein